MIKSWSVSAMHTESWYDTLDIAVCTEEGLWRIGVIDFSDTGGAKEVTLNYCLRAAIPQEVSDLAVALSTGYSRNIVQQVAAIPVLVVEGS